MMQVNKIIAIHQPNFFPWLGYFDKIVQSDAFVILDDVQFPKKGGSWSNRVKLLLSCEARWVTAAIDRHYHGVKNINEMKFSNDNSWQEKMVKSIEINYIKSPFFSEIFSFLEPLINNSENNIADFNNKAILNICNKIGINTDKIYWSSKLPHNGVSNELLISLTKALGGNAYMCGGGAEEYQDESIFIKSGINLMHQNFKHPKYTQHNSNEFIAGLSIIDTLMNLGVEQTRNLFN